MNPRMLAGIILIVIGVVGLAYGGFSFTTREQVAKIGPIEIEADKERTVPIAPIVGGLALAGGVALLVMGRKGGAA